MEVSGKHLNPNQSSELLKLSLVLKVLRWKGEVGGSQNKMGSQVGPKNTCKMRKKKLEEKENCCKRDFVVLLRGQSELTATNALVGRSVHWMGCIFSFGAEWGSSQSISFCC